MEIILKRIAKQKNYTIGRLYIVNAGVEREILPGKRLDDKRIIRAAVILDLDIEHPRPVGTDGGAGPGMLDGQVAKGEGLAGQHGRSRQGEDSEEDQGFHGIHNLD